MRRVETVELKRPARAFKCPYCGCTSLKHDEHEDTVYVGDGNADAVYECKSCGTKFAIYLESIPENLNRRTIEEIPGA